MLVVARDFFSVGNPGKILWKSCPFRVAIGIFCKHVTKRIKINKFRLDLGEFNFYVRWGEFRKLSFLHEVWLIFLIIDFLVDYFKW